MSHRKKFFPVIISALVVAVLFSALVTYHPQLGWNRVYRAFGLIEPDTDRGEVHFIDVGQGDSILLCSASSFTLVDGGPRAKQVETLDYIRARGITRLDAVFATHLHEDHIGGLAAILAEISARTVYLVQGAPGSEKDTKTYQNLMKVIAAQGLSVVKPEPGTRFALDRFDLEILAPLTEFSSDENNNSIVIRAEYGKISFLLTGDAEKESEAAMLQSGRTLSATVLKMGHHGSKTSTTEAFLAAVRPLYAVISCGRNNAYGHPNDDVVARVEKAGARIYRTDVNGTVVVFTDGEQVEVKTAA